jgi:hypothetical protein
MWLFRSKSQETCVLFFNTTICIEPLNLLIDLLLHKSITHTINAPLLSLMFFVLFFLFPFTAKGYDQLLWVLGEDEIVTEAGTMNFFVHWKNEKGEEELATPVLDGTILPGVTRQSVLDLTRQVFWCCCCCC